MLIAQAKEQPVQRKWTERKQLVSSQFSKFGTSYNLGTSYFLFDLLVRGKFKMLAVRSSEC